MFLKGISIISKLARFRMFKVGIFSGIYFLIAITNIFALQKPDPSSFEFKDRIDFIPFVEIYKTEKKIDVADLDKLIESYEIERAKNKSSQGISNSYYWIKFTIDWAQQNSGILLELDNPHINEVLLFKKINNTYKKIGFGGDKNYKFRDRSYSNRRYIFPLNIRLCYHHNLLLILIWKLILNPSSD